MACLTNPSFKNKLTKKMYKTTPNDYLSYILIYGYAAVLMVKFHFEYLNEMDEVVKILESVDLIDQVFPNQITGETTQILLDAYTNDAIERSPLIDNSIAYSMIIINELEDAKY